jgi:hypothetical protein
VQDALDVIDAHRVLSNAFGRVALTADPWRVFSALNLCVDTLAYEVLVIGFSVRARRHTVADLPCLPPDVGLPTLAWLGWPHFEAGWAVAARIDPVRVLPFMNWCLGSWDAAPASELGWRHRIHLGEAGYDGAWTAQADPVWYCAAVVNGRWLRVRCTIGAGGASVECDGAEYARPGRLGDPGTPQQFVRTDVPDDVVEVWWSWEIAQRPDFARSRGDYGAMWAAELFGMPLLTCAKQWELT